MIKARAFAALFLCLPLCGQDYPPNEFYAGYSVSGQIAPPITSGLNLPTSFRTQDGGKLGYDISYIRNFNSKIGLKVDFSSYIDNASNNGIFEETVQQPYTLHAHSYNLMLGPEWRFANASHFTPFVYVLAGAAHVTSDFDTSSGVFSGGVQTDHNGAELAAGVGMDARVASRLSIRMAIDYNPTLLGSAFSGASEIQNNFRFHVGLLMHNAYDQK
jgi:opacity protein-like surface antigen